MNEDRKRLLSRLRSDKKDSNMVIISDGEPFVKALQTKIDNLKDTLGMGIEFHDIDQLINTLQDVGQLSEPVSELKAELAKLKIPEMPEEIKLAGIADLLTEITKLKSKEPVVKVDWMNDKALKAVLNRLDNVIQATESIKLKPDQEPQNFMPVRKVILVGNRFLFDDSRMTGGGGGGGTAPPNMLYQPIVQGNAGTTNLVGGRAGQRIKVTNYVVVLGGAGTVKFQSDGGDLTGAMSFAANGGVSSGGTEFSPAFQGALGGTLDIITTGAAGNGHIAYFFE